MMTIWTICLTRTREDGVGVRLLAYDFVHVLLNRLAKYLLYATSIARCW